MTIRTNGSGHDQHRVVFTPSGLSGRVAAGTTVLEAARQLGVDLDSVCGGRGICGRCQVVPSIGSFPKWGVIVQPDHVTDPDAIEAGYRGRRPLVEGHRLGCALRIVGDLVVDVPPASQIHKQVVRKEIGLEGVTIDPVVVARYVELQPGETAPNVLDGLRRALARTWGVAGFEPTTEVLRTLYAAVAAEDGRVTVALRDQRLVAVWPGYVDRIAGVAIDVGSTTIAGHLCDLASGEVLASAGLMNPQLRFGEDLMSRVSYVMLHPDGAGALTAVVREALDGLVGELLDAADLPRSQLLEVVVVGNPIMHHLVLGIDPTPLGQAPFALATSDRVEARATDVGIDAPAGRLYVAPCVAGHVGADTAAAILAEGPHRSSAVQLLVDVGTNAEIVLGNDRALFAASSPTGPAFEGAQISCGQRATAGAIERVRIDRSTLEPRVKVIGCERWSDEVDFPRAVAATGVTGVCGSGIVEVIGELFLAGVIDAQGVIRPELAARTDRVVPDGRTASYVLHRPTDGGPELRITQADVRAIQLAKAALRAGVDLLRERAALDRIDDVRLAGAFGTHLDPLYALVLGLVPDVPLAAVRSVGNAAGSGAVRALLSGTQRAEVEAVVRGITKIETATEPRFQELFVAALAFPHRDAASPHLAEVVPLPERAEHGAVGAPARRRRTGHRARPRPS
ncbi:ASKHA domain-containing protein [Egicoccus sp. AB-alg2]|uniref:ASKHA domain-containing protein n=1 Tax=Egicoccus sp. AB-alg2 TaxID=3242693 RepID=UPI00359ED7E6